MLDKRILRYLVLIPFALGMSFNSQAMDQPNLEEKKNIDLIKARTKYADCVVIGKVIKIEGHSKDHYKSWVWVEVEEYLKEEQDKSKPIQDTILIKSIAGIIDTITGEAVAVFISLEGPPTLEDKILCRGGQVPSLTKINERVLLFLTRSPEVYEKTDTIIRTNDCFYIITYYRIKNDKVFRWDAGYIKTEEGMKFNWDGAYVSDLPEFKKRILAAVREEKSGGEK